MILEKPLTNFELFMAAEEGWITPVVPIDLSNVIDHNLEGFLDLAVELVGGPLLSDIRYSVVGHIGDTLYIQVEASLGMVSMDLDEWSVAQCQQYLDKKLGIDLKYVAIADDDAEAWRVFTEEKAASWPRERAAQVGESSGQD